MPSEVEMICQADGLPMPLQRRQGKGEARRCEFAVACAWVAEGVG